MPEPWEPQTLVSLLVPWMPAGVWVRHLARGGSSCSARGLHLASRSQPCCPPLRGLGDLRVHPPSSLFSLQVPPEVAYDVLSMADMYLLPGLKRLCGRSLAQLLDEDSVVGLWRVAKLFRLARLEDQCTEYMAKVIEKVGRGELPWVGAGCGGWQAAVCPECACSQLVEQEDFAEAVREEAAAVRGRQEQDSIPLVDDIRFHITSVVQTYSNIKEMERRLHALEDLLVSIGLDC